MSIDMLVGDPEEITQIEEVDEVLGKIRAYEMKIGCPAGVIMIQNRTLGNTFEIVSQEESDEWLSTPVRNRPRTCEWGVRFYPRSFFEELKPRLKNSSKEPHYSP